ncbi:MAG: hypothetical protein CMK09_03980 [Ponticaulis sp.]|nr:hypothetical protein [Ponticaulis sp.]|tara:strand:- start:2287 stop:2634 length:348 start_codon:yes stop_codon:yes gene_type:complete
MLSPKAMVKMRLFVLISILMSTFPVLGLNLLPKAGEDMLGIFPREMTSTEIVSEAKRLGLEIVSYDEKFRHLIVRDQSGNTQRTLKALGADYVLSADFAAFCSPKTNTSQWNLTS